MLHFGTHSHINTCNLTLTRAQALALALVLHVDLISHSFTLFLFVCSMGRRETILEDDVSRRFEEEMALHPSFNAPQFRHVARVFDTDRDGCISAVNFQRTLIEMGINISRTSLGEYMAKSIRRGHINIEEFAEHIEEVRHRVIHDIEEERKKTSPVRVHAPYVDEIQDHEEHRLKRQSSLPWSHNFDRVSTLQHGQTRPDMF
jgi:hypothetical protein